MGAPEKTTPSSLNNNNNNNNNNSMQRVKVYRLNDDGKWDDQGTGHVTIDYLDVRHNSGSEDLGLFVIDEEDNETLFVHRISSDDIYRKQKDTIISWRDSEYSSELALSFQETTGCSYIWDHICNVQRSLHFTTISKYGEFNIEDLENMTKSASKTPSSGRRLPLRSGTKRGRTADQVVADEYPEKRSTSTPVNDIPIARIIPNAALRASYDAVLRAMDHLGHTYNEVVKEQTESITNLNKQLEKSSEECGSLSSIIAKFQVQEKVHKTEIEKLQKEIENLKINQKMELKQTIEKVRAVGMKCAAKALLENKIKMAKVAKAAGATIEDWDADKWEQDLLEKYPAKALSKQKSAHSEEKAEEIDKAEET